MHTDKIVSCWKTSYSCSDAFSATWVGHRNAIMTKKNDTEQVYSKQNAVLALCMSIVNSCSAFLSQGTQISKIKPNLAIDGVKRPLQPRKYERLHGSEISSIPQIHCLRRLLHNQ